MFYEGISRISCLKTVKVSGTRWFPGLKTVVFTTVFERFPHFAKGTARQDSPNHWSKPHVLRRYFANVRSQDGEGLQDSLVP